MALNKARTSVWVKALIIILIIAFISLFMYTGIAGIFDLFRPSTTETATSADPVATINQKNQPIVDSLRALASSQPTSYTPAVNLANAYFDWAQQLSIPQTGQSQATSAAITAAVGVWGEARAAYDQASKLGKTFDPSVQTDRSIATFYSNDTTSAITIAREVTTKQPTFAPAWLNLGLYYDATNNTALAIEAYKKYLVLDPKGSSSNISYATSRIKALGGSVSTSTTP
ncbi:MAG TPA: hypothetical protein VIL41_02555 [Coriobacteriia bacterium]